MEEGRLDTSTTLKESHDRVNQKKLGQAAGQRGKAKARPLIAKSRGLMQAVVNNQSKKVSTRRNK